MNTVHNEKDLKNIATESAGVRHLVMVSKPLIQNSEIFLTLTVADYGGECILYPLKNIDDYHVIAHLMFKLSSDENRIITVSAVITDDGDKLYFTKWNFCTNQKTCYNGFE